MNDSLIASKKFRAAIFAAASGILTFLVSEFGLKLDVEKTLSLMGVIVAPLLIYVGAEGYAERDAKKVVEESKARKELSEFAISLVDKENKNNGESII